MLKDPSSRYRPFAGPELHDRRWPARRISAAPRWLSTDLRDGNQALVDPMGADLKLRLWERLVSVGFKEIEVAFPSASETEFDFVRRLIEDDRVPPDVTLQVLTPARPELIRRTFESLQGARQATVHLYNATSPVFREQVFGKTPEAVIAMAVNAMALMVDLAKQRPETRWSFEYSPETFSATEMSFAKEIVDAVSAAAGATIENPLVVNLPNTVEVATPNVYADQVEWMHRNLARREALVLSVHPHNDRGTAVAAAELAIMAGAQRVEGCLFGNGERTGNVCLVTLAMNLYTQGIDPRLDLGDMDGVRADCEACTGLTVHSRHPYAGDLVYTAFSGTHQDAIRKGMAAQADREYWQVPYLPLDPADVGRDYRAVVRVNGQSGKGGIAFLLEREFGIVLPRDMQVELRERVQQIADAEGGELNAQRIREVLDRTFVHPPGPHRYVSHQLDEDTARSEWVTVQVDMDRGGVRRSGVGAGQGPIDAFASMLREGGEAVEVLDYHEHAVGAGAGATAAAYVSLRTRTGEPVWGMGLDPHIVTASFKALVSAMNRADG